MLEPDDDEAPSETVIDKTVESGEFPELPVSDENKTIPDQSGAQTVSDDVDEADDAFSPLMIRDDADDENLTIVEGAGAETVSSQPRPGTCR